MGTRIRCVEERSVTVYNDDATIRTHSYSGRYLTEDVDDPALSKWVEFAPARDDTRTVTAQRDHVEAAARSAEGIPPREQGG